MWQVPAAFAPAELGDVQYVCLRYDGISKTHRQNRKLHKSRIPVLHQLKSRATLWFTVLCKGRDWGSNHFQCGWQNAGGSSSIFRLVCSSKVPADTRKSWPTNQIPVILIALSGNLSVSCSWDFFILCWFTGGFVFCWVFLLCFHHIDHFFLYSLGIWPRLRAFFSQTKNNYS